jgi:hypothetical protein
MEQLHKWTKHLVKGQFTSNMCEEEVGRWHKIYGALHPNSKLRNTKPSLGVGTTGCGKLVISRPVPNQSKGCGSVGFNIIGCAGKEIWRTYSLPPWFNLVSVSRSFFLPQRLISQQQRMRSVLRSAMQDKSVLCCTYRSRSDSGFNDSTTTSGMNLHCNSDRIASCQWSAVHRVQNEPPLVSYTKGSRYY